jgi:hypothetical protein
VYKLEDEIDVEEWEIFSFPRELYLHDIFLLKEHRGQFDLINPYSDKIWKNVKYYCKVCLEEKFRYDLYFLKNIITRKE